MKLIKEYKWWLLFIIVLAIAIVIMKFSVSDAKNNKFDPLSNWERNEEKILSAKRYLESITSDSFLIFIEYGSKNFIRDIQLTQFGGDNIEIYAKDVSINSAEVKKICEYLKWDVSDLLSLYEKLKKANCISAANTNPFHIGYNKEGLGKFSYVIFDRPIADSMFKAYNNTCKYKYYNTKLIIEYEGGAIGPQCF